MTFEYFCFRSSTVVGTGRTDTTRVEAIEDRLVVCIANIIRLDHGPLLRWQLSFRTPGASRWSPKSLSVSHTIGEAPLGMPGSCSQGCLPRQLGSCIQQAYGVDECENANVRSISTEMEEPDTSSPAHLRNWHLWKRWLSHFTFKRISTSILTCSRSSYLWLSVTTVSEGDTQLNSGISKEMLDWIAQVVEVGSTVREFAEMLPDYQPGVWSVSRDFTFAFLTKCCAFNWMQAASSALRPECQNVYSCGRDPQGLQNLMHQQFGMLVDPLTLKSEGWLWMRKPKNLSHLPPGDIFVTQHAHHHLPLSDSWSSRMSIICILIWLFSKHRLEFTIYLFLHCSLHSGFAFQFCMPFFVSFSGLNFSRNSLYFASIFFQLCAANRHKSICGFHASITLLKAFWRWCSLPPGGIIMRSFLEGIIFPSTWGCLGKENSKDAPNFLTPPAQPFWGSSSSCLARSFPKRAYWKEMPQARSGYSVWNMAPKKWKPPWLVACGSNKHSVMI